MISIGIKKSSSGKLNALNGNYARGGLKGVEIIRTRTKSGKDVNGKKFKEYSEVYKVVKKNKRPGVDIDKPDLILTGKMMANLKLKSSSKKDAVIGFTGKETIKMASNNAIRRFFDFSKKEFDRIMQVIFK